MADESHFGGWWVTQECLEVEASEAKGPSPQSWIEMKKIILLANPGYAFEPGTTFSIPWYLSTLEAKTHDNGDLQPGITRFVQFG